MQKTRTDDDRRPGRPTREQAAAIADAVLAGAYEVFVAQGYGAAGMDEIAAHVGVSKLTIYRRFPSKEALLVAVVNYRIARMVSEIDASASGFECSIDALRHTIKTLFDGSITPDLVRFSTLLLCESAHNESLRARFNEWQHLTRAPVCDQIVVAQESGRIIDADPRLLCDMLCDLMDGLPKSLRQGTVNPAEIDPEVFFQERWNFFLRAVRP